jgi:penicillin-binding protein 2
MIRRKKSLGIAFKDELSKVAFSGHFKNPTINDTWKDNFLPNFNPDSEVLEPSIWRTFAILSLVTVVFFVLFVRLFHLQIVKGEENRSLADGNRIQIKLIHAPRGLILDRNGKILASNSPGFRLFEGDKARYVSRDDALKMEASNDPRFKNLEVDNIRAYPLGEKAAHLLGYASEITADELKDSRYSGYKQGDRVGRGGVEEAFESSLKGIDGGEVIEVDAQGKPSRTLRRTETIPGNNVYLNIDSDLQTVVFNQLSEGVKKANSCCGALVVEDPSSGAILALASVPSFDPTKVSDYLVAANSPILNRAIAGVYPPGSTFKIASALSGLSSGKITSDTHFEDTGFINLGIFKFSNWYFTQYGKVEGSVDLVKALQRSNDIFFYYLGQSVGEKTLGETAKSLGLGSRVGIDIPGESAGLIPDNDWKQKNFDEVWFPGDTLHMAIGQGFVTSTPLQISNLVSEVAVSKRYPPHLLLKITHPDGKEISRFKSDGISLKFKPEDISLVKRGLDLVPKDGGTAWPFFSFPVATAGKTGTAEFGDPKDRTHAWYTSYAPLDDPKIAVTVLVEAGGEGSTNASPIAKEVYRWYFSDDKNNLIKDNGAIATDSARKLGE